MDVVNLQGSLILLSTFVHELLWHYLLLIPIIIFLHPSLLGIFTPIEIAIAIDFGLLGLLPFYFLFILNIIQI